MSANDPNLWGLVANAVAVGATPYQAGVMAMAHAMLGAALCASLGWYGLAPGLAAVPDDFFPGSIGMFALTNSIPTAAQRAAIFAELAL